MIIGKSVVGKYLLYHFIKKILVYYIILFYLILKSPQYKEHSTIYLTNSLEYSGL